MSIVSIWRATALAAAFAVIPVVGPQLTPSGLSAALAQPLSEDEISQRWRAQAEALRRRQEAGLLGQTRGLRVAPPPGAPPPPAEAAPKSMQVALRVTFASGSAALTDAAIGELGALCSAIGQAPATWRFNVVGHTDAAGSAAFNDALSYRRAASVGAHLSSKCSVSSERLRFIGMGERALLPDAPPVSEQNRRVEVSITQI